MNHEVQIVFRTVLIGVGATATLDLWNALLQRFFGIPSLNMGMLGRWFGHFSRRQFVHASIANASPIPGERIIGWSAHYAIGISWAALLMAIWGWDWARQPTLFPALSIGLGTVVAPFFVMQPALGLGIAASKTPHPNIARLKSIVSHTVFGFGLYGTAWLSAFLAQR